MKNKNLKIGLSIITLIFSIAAASIGFGLLDTIQSFSMRFTCGFFFIGTPILVIGLIIVLFRKNESEKA